MLNACDIMQRVVETCDPTTKLTTAATVMRDGDIGSLPVIDPVSEMPVGMITDRDIVLEAVSNGLRPNQSTVGDLMTTPPVCAPLNASLAECAELMGYHRIRRLPLVNTRGRCVGIVTLGDLSRHLPDRAAADLLRRVTGDG